MDNELMGLSNPGYVLLIMLAEGCCIAIFTMGFLLAFKYLLIYEGLKVAIVYAIALILALGLNVYFLKVALDKEPRNIL
jgi:hypothetical protein